MRSHDKVHSIDVDVSHMSEQEVTKFGEVLNRNDAINQIEVTRIRRLKSGASTPILTISSPTLPQQALPRPPCQRCGSPCVSPTLDAVTCTCRFCRCLLCRQCWGNSPQSRLHICSSCYQAIVLDAKTGTWFHQLIKKRLSTDAATPMTTSTPDYHRDTYHCAQSPRKNLLRRLRSYNSIHKELDEYDSSNNTEARSRREDECPDDRSCHYESSEEDHQGSLDESDGDSNRNFYRSLSHVNANPIRSSSNGGPIYIDDKEAVPKAPDPAQVLIELDFNFRMSQFIVVLRQCRHLQPAGSSTTSICPYLFILLLPDRSRKSRRTTSVMKNASCPTFDQIFKYSINFSELETRSLLIMLCHKDNRSTRDTALGQVVISLSYMDFNKPVMRWYTFQSMSNVLHPRRSLSNVSRRESNIPPYFGEISMAIKYVPRSLISVTSLCQTDSEGELHVWIKSMRNIASHQWTSSPTVASRRRFSTVERSGEMNVVNGLSFGGNRLMNAVTMLAQNRPVARVCLLPYRTDSQTTPPARSQTDNKVQFVWSTILKFQNVDLHDLRVRSMEVTVWVNSRHGWLQKIIQSKCLGGVRLSYGSATGGTEDDNSSGFSTGLIEEKMWNAVLDRPNTWVDGTVKLKMDSSFLSQFGVQ